LRNYRLTKTGDDEMHSLNHNPNYPAGFTGTIYDGADADEIDRSVTLHGNHPANVVPTGSTTFDLNEEGRASRVFFSTNIAMGAGRYEARGNDLEQVQRWLRTPDGIALLKSRGVI
jgi:hypothetical protein